MVTFLIQVLGIGRIAAAVKGQGKTDVDMLKQGLNILRLGLILQMFCFGLFGVVGIHFLIVSRQWVVPMSRARKGQWQRLNLGLNLAATLITVSRSVASLKLAIPADKSSFVHFTASLSSAPHLVNPTVELPTTFILMSGHSMF